MISSTAPNSARTEVLIAAAFAGAPFEEARAIQEDISIRGCLTAARPQPGRRRAGRDAAHARAVHDGAQRISPRDGADAVAGRPRICGRGGESRSLLGSGAPFWRLFISFALHRRLPADSRRRISDSRPPCGAAMPRDGGHGPGRDRFALPSRIQDVRQAERVCCVRAARAVSRVRHLLDAGFERRSNHDCHDPDGDRALSCERGGRRAPVVTSLDYFRSTLRSARGFHRDDPSHQRNDAGRHRHGDVRRSLSTPARRVASGCDRVRVCIRDFSDLAGVDELSLSRRVEQQRLCVLGSRGLRLVRQNFQRALPVRPDDAGKSLRQRPFICADAQRPRWNARRSRRSSLLDVSIRRGGFCDRWNRRRIEIASSNRSACDVVWPGVPRSAGCAVPVLLLHRDRVHSPRDVHSLRRGRLWDRRRQSRDARGTHSHAQEFARSMPSSRG